MTQDGGKKIALQQCIHPLLRWMADYAGPSQQWAEFRAGDSMTTVLQHSESKLTECRFLLPPKISNPCDQLHTYKTGVDLFL